MDLSKRMLFTGKLPVADKSASPKVNSSKEYSALTDQYFDSFENCYPLLASAGSLLNEAAHFRGIDTKDRSQESIARELFESGFIFPTRT